MNMKNEENYKEKYNINIKPTESKRCHIREHLDFELNNLEEKVSALVEAENAIQKFNLTTITVCKKRGTLWQQGLIAHRKSIASKRRKMHNSQQYINNTIFKLIEVVRMEKNNEKKEQDASSPLVNTQTTKVLTPMMIVYPQ